MIALGVVKVTGRSMEPALHTGDRMLVLHGAPPRPGRMAIVRLPPESDGTPRPLAIKRVTGRDPSDPSRYWIESDNPEAEGVVDSWRIGSLERQCIRALVLFRIPTRLRIPRKPRRLGGRGAH